MKIAISACLLGDKVRYDGKDQLNKQLVKLLKKHHIIKICPEISSGFDIPRKAMEIKDNRVINIDNEDLTDKLIEGCRICFDKASDCDLIILKSKSPSCGYGQTYDGTFTNTLINKNGLFSQMCIDNKMKVYTEKDIEILKEILK